MIGEKGGQNLMQIYPPTRLFLAAQILIQKNYFRNKRKENLYFLLNHRIISSQNIKKM